MAAPNTASVVAYGACVCTTPPTSGRIRYIIRCIGSSEDGRRWPSTTWPSVSTMTTSAAPMSGYGMLVGLIATWFGATRALRLPAVWFSRPSRSRRRPRSAISRRVTSKSMPFLLPYRRSRRREYAVGFLQYGCGRGLIANDDVDQAAPKGSSYDLCLLKAAGDADD